MNNETTTLQQSITDSKLRDGIDLRALKKLYSSGALNNEQIMLIYLFVSGFSSDKQQPVRTFSKDFFDKTGLSGDDTFIDSILRPWIGVGLITGYPSFQRWSTEPGGIHLHPLGLEKARELIHELKDELSGRSLLAKYEELQRKINALKEENESLKCEVRTKNEIILAYEEDPSKA